jgi:hypothetical protein
MLGCAAMADIQPHHCAVVSIRQRVAHATAVQCDNFPTLRLERWDWAHAQYKKHVSACKVYP